MLFCHLHDDAIHTGEEKAAQETGSHRDEEDTRVNLIHESLDSTFFQPAQLFPGCSDVPPAGSFGLSFCVSALSLETQRSHVPHQSSLELGLVQFCLVSSSSPKGRLCFLSLHGLPSSLQSDFYPHQGISQ